ncbi:LexA repressor [Trichinella spiralis]|uniref:LexA repressor n=2 Tax=Trichinella spiralis TaxID=6334 RepID=A0ABR3K5H5_TRISP|nr:hypothetical protein T01_5672 [Trichinella spiralis]
MLCNGQKNGSSRPTDDGRIRPAERHEECCRMQQNRLTKTAVSLAIRDLKWTLDIVDKAAENSMQSALDKQKPLMNNR